MYNELKNITLPCNVIVNPETMEKERFHGTLTAGIYSNMIYAHKKFEFLYLIVLSSRNLFYNKLNIDFIIILYQQQYNHKVIFLILDIFIFSIN